MLSLTKLNLCLLAVFAILFLASCEKRDLGGSTPLNPLDTSTTKPVDTTSNNPNNPVPNTTPIRCNGADSTSVFIPGTVTDA